MIMERSKSCISDRPIDLIDGDTDLLENSKYAQALIDFISKAETPITIGIQGGWGMGKTSLINLIKHKLQHASKDNPDDKTLCVMVNAWEHSLFQDSNDKSRVAISLLSGIFSEISEVIDKTEDIEANIKKDALQKLSGLRKIGQALTGTAAVLMKVGAKWVADLEVPDNQASERDAKPASFADIRTLRDNLKYAVDAVAKNTPYKRFVCFVDDLDRIPPKTAVEILDTMKNVLDVPHCVFMLAIDYDVVVKGLEDRFGEKTIENEREFRQYFDKIIQVPFAMPVQASSEKLEKFLTSSFKAISLEFPDDIRGIAQVAHMATDGIPRSIKRIINTMSLLSRTGDYKHDDNQHEDTSDRVNILFIVVALQINFPEIYRRLAESPLFREWTIDKYEERWDLDKRKLDESRLKSFGEAFDEEWEKVLYLLCQQQDWLKRKAGDISKILNELHKMLPQDNAESQNGSLTLYFDALAAVNVTSVDDADTDWNCGQVPREDNITLFWRKIHERLIQTFGEQFVIDPVSDKIWAKKLGRGRSRKYEFSFSGGNFCEISIIWDGNDIVDIWVLLKPNWGRKNEFRAYVEGHIPDGVYGEEYKDWYCIKLNGFKDASCFSEKNLDKVHRALEEFISKMEKICKGFR